MGITTSLSEPYFTGAASLAELVPSVYPVALDGRPYVLDTQPEAADMRLRFETIPLLRQQADAAQTPAEASLNPDGYWRRAQDSWHHGAGQTYRDRDENADIYRFRTSKGIDVWTRYQATLLPETERKLVSANTNLPLVAAGARLYVGDGSTLKYTTSITGAGVASWTTVTGYTGGAILSLCSDGFTVYFTDGADVWTTNTGTGAATSANTINAGVIRWVKARLMIAGTGGTKNSIYNITTIGTPPTALATHFNADFTWVDFAEGTANIYAAGYSGDKSLIYRIAIKQDASALDPPIVAGSLPDGEIIAAIHGYLDNIWIGTNKGWRFSTVDPQGNLDIGPLVTTAATVQAFEPQDRFMWFGLTNYDTTSTGLGRSDPTQEIVLHNQIAHASDLMATGQGAVLSLATFQSLRVFSVSGLGVYAETTSKVATASIESGHIGYGLPDPKTLSFVHVDTAPLTGSLSAELATDSDAFVEIGSESAAGDTSSSFPVEFTAERFEVKIVLNRSGSDATLGPTLLRWTLKAFPAQQDGSVSRIFVPILLAHKYYNRLPLAWDVETEFDVLDALRTTRRLVTLQLFHASYTGLVEDYSFLPFGLRDAPDGSFTTDGTMTIVFKRIS